MSEEISVQDPRLIRELYTVERVIDKDQLIGKYVNPRLFLLKSKLDLYANQELVLRAFYEWKQLHPLLQANLIKVKANNNIKYYLAQAPKEQVEHSQNVHFINYQSKDNNKDEIENCWKLLYENEYYIPIDSKNSLLWRAIFVQLPKHNDCFRYGFVINLHHSITDGKNAYCIVQEFLKILEDLNCEYKKNENYKLRANFEINYPNDPRAGEKSPDFEYTHSDEPSVVTLVPEYLKPNTIQETFEDEKIFDGGKFVTLDGKIFLTTKEIFEKRLKSVHRMCYLDLSQETFTNLIKKSVDLKIKLNGCFEMIALIAWRRIVRQFSGDEGLDPIVKYQIPINLRPFLEPPLDDSCMGVWISSFVPDVKIEHEESEPEFWTKLFWEMARKRSEAIHDYLNQKSFFKKENLIQEQNIYYMLENGWKAKDVFIMYAVSNIGRMTGALNGSNRTIEIFEHHEGLAYTPECFITAAYHGICSVDGKLCWGITWNKQFLRQEVVHLWRDHIIDIFNILAN